jgi:MoxR-like ATPase
VSSPRDILHTIREELRQTFLERDELIDGALVALLAAQHVLVIGPPGTAKSMLADEVCRRLTGARYFQWLLTRFTTPEELFGAVSLKALRRTTTGDSRRTSCRRPTSRSSTRSSRRARPS